MPKCTINGQEVEVKEGASVIEAFAQVDEEIAHYCWHPGLSVAGVCRMCMVEIEGQPRLQIACNTQVNEGMVITNRSEKAEEAVKWALDFHLINHPLDCPICDQAGECGLQNQYMRFGRYEPEMSERKVKKQKVVDLGPTVVLDSERCILCSRCVRFTDEVSQTSELGIFNRGDRSEIGTFDGQPLDNKYSLNTVDICPVGALTSKDFRFQQRVWFLKEHETICTGCSTGCNVKLSYNKVDVFRSKPVHNPEINGYWMCDEGRDIRYLNRSQRLLRASKWSGGAREHLAAGAAAKEAAELVRAGLSNGGASSIGVVITAQFSCEESEAFLAEMKALGLTKVFYWVNNKEQFDDFDGLLLRGDRNPNTKGLLAALEQNGFQQPWSELESALQAGHLKTLIVAGPENQAVYADIAAKAELFAQAENVIWLTACPVASFDAAKSVGYQIPLKTYVEKDGTFINFQGVRQEVSAGPVIVSEALTLAEAATLLAGKELNLHMSKSMHQQGRIVNELEQERGQV